jgi:hypothetical protein
MRFVDWLKRLVAASSRAGQHRNQRSRRPDQELGGLRSKDIEKLPPERAAELAGHAPERVDT